MIISHFLKARPLLSLSQADIQLECPYPAVLVLHGCCSFSVVDVHPIATVKYFQYHSWATIYVVATRVYSRVVLFLFLFFQYDYATIGLWSQLDGPEKGT